MDRYSNFSIDDFVWDDYFRQWILSPDHDSITFWNTWLDAHSEMTEKVERARAILLSMQIEEPEISDEEINKIVKRTVGLYDGTNTKIQKLTHRNVSAPFSTWMRFAASIILVTLLGWTAYSVLVNRKEKSQVEEQLTAPAAHYSIVEKTNTTTRTMELTLRDGSHISLAPKGSVRYSEPFQKERREIHLTGEAFFDIRKNPDQPFLVFANGLITKVLGTSFRVKASEDRGEVTVEVKTGKVAVFAQADPHAYKKLEDKALQGTILKPNQKIIYAGKEVKMVKTLVEKPEIVVSISETPKFVFEDTPASDVLNTLGKAYGIDIIYDTTLLKHCLLTALLEGLTLHDKLDIICKAVESSYEIVDGQVIIHSNGCKN
ncbi:FecR family protein [Dyadobacter aurulentus]|uniref:FecR family protein n=1 Tax=Dyadobacter sp. UC 10 TaxID=2605428 RepID=UPI0011F2FBE7|nr:FecR family protein [Dyadobacter sp. UC 10]KAA0992731.1 FecR family protein [Dyadobacter sp. UC 10]